MAWFVVRTSTDPAVLAGPIRREMMSLDREQPIDQVGSMEQTFSSIKQMAKEAGREPSELGMLVHAILELTDKPLGNDRAIFSGSLEQIADDVRGCAKIGVSEIFFDPAFSSGGQSLDRWMSLLEQMQPMMKVS